MIREATAMNVRQNLGELLNEVRYRKGTVIITKAGQPVAAIVDLETLKTMQQGARSDQAALAAKIQDAFKDMPAAELDALVDAAMGAVRPAYRTARKVAARANIRRK
jgi:prevent-host-death family protein